MCLGSFYLPFECRARRFGFFFYFKELPYHIIIKYYENRIVHVSTMFHRRRTFHGKFRSSYCCKPKTFTKPQLYNSMQAYTAPTFIILYTIQLDFTARFAKRFQNQSSETHNVLLTNVQHKPRIPRLGHEKSFSSHPLESIK